ncbi:MAG: hypothetical protein KAW89_04035 [Armatimonadetes bacterium]|nr:hypothetical protein [Armatimonadota bacterium]
MSAHRWLLATIVVLVVLIAGVSAWYARAENGDDSAATTSEETAQIENPVVAAIVYQQETEYEPDPFEPDRVRRTRTEVKELIIVRADGTIERKRAW